MPRISDITTLVEGDAVGSLKVNWDMEYSFKKNNGKFERHDEVGAIHRLNFLLFDKISFDFKYMLQDPDIRATIAKLMLDHVAGLEVFEIGGIDFGRLVKNKT